MKTTISTTEGKPELNRLQPNIKKKKLLHISMAAGGTPLSGRRNNVLTERRDLWGAGNKLAGLPCLIKREGKKTTPCLRATRLC